MEALLLCCLHQFGNPPFQGSVWGRHVLTRGWKFPGNVLGTEWYCPKTLWPKLGFLLHIFLVGIPYDDIDHKHWHLDVGVKRWSLFSNSGPISVRSYPSPTHSYFWPTEPVEIIGLECGVLQLLLFSNIEDKRRIWPSLLSICPHSSLLFHLDFVAAVVFVAVFFAIVTIFGTNCLDPLSLWHCSFSNWIINSSMIWVIIAKSCAYIQNRRNDSCWPLKIWELVVKLSLKSLGI